MFHKILVAVDLSKNSDKVFDEAFALAKAMGTRLMLLHVLSGEEKDYPTLPMVTVVEYYPLNEIMFEDYQKKWLTYETKGLDLLRSYADRATAEGIDTEFTQNSGNPGPVICATAQNWGADLIVIGRRGHSGLSELILGSVSNYVLHHARCSVFTVQGQTQTELGSQSCPSEVASAIHS